MGDAVCAGEQEDIIKAFDQAHYVFARCGGAEVAVCFFILIARRDFFGGDAVIDGCRNHAV